MFKLSRYISLAAAVAALTVIGTGKAGAVVLTFEGLQQSEPVLNFYNGGMGGLGSGPGPDFGATFSANALASIDADAGGLGNFGGEPWPSTALFFLAGPAGATMNVPIGFDTGLSLFYSAIADPAIVGMGSIKLFDAPDATGNLLATLNLPQTPFNSAPDPTGEFSPFVPISVTFSGIARSVNFVGPINQIAFDNITFAPIPEPASLAILGVGLLPLLRRRRRRP